MSEAESSLRSLEAFPPDGGIRPDESSPTVAVAMIAGEAGRTRPPGSALQAICPDFDRAAVR
jgi:hypothetical protein